MALTVLFADPRVLVVDKPSGVAVHRGWAADRVTLMTRARDRAGTHVYPVHRLDRGTSGAVVFGLDPEAASALSEAFRAQRVEKRYLALVRGIPPEEGTIDHAIPRSEDGPRVDARTRYRRLGIALDRFSLVEAIPETGRLHQIRRHFKHISHPVIGDTRYGDGKENRRLRAEANLNRLALHASWLRFPHPASGEPIEVRAPVPDDLRGPLEILGLAESLP